MTKDQKSPQQKKELEFAKDHFTFGMDSSRAFPKTWKRKKTHANRQLRHKSDQLLTPVKPEMSAEDVDLAVGDVTPRQIAKALISKRLRKSSTVSVGDKVKLKLENRAERVGRKTGNRRMYDLMAAEAIATLNSLEGELLADFVRRALVFLHRGDPIKWVRAKRSDDRIDRALSFLEGHQRGGPENEALCRNEMLRDDFERWRSKANRILSKDRRALLAKIEQKEAAEKKVKALRRLVEANSTAR
jgi:hypothetical protein